jgi:predicted Zn-dependent protease
MISLTLNTLAWSQSPGDVPSTSGVSGDTAAPGEAVKDALYEELSKLVPGDVAAGSQTESALKAAIDLFGERKPLEAQQALKDLAAADANFPPADLMLAAMAYAINDNKSGSRLLEQAAVKSGDYPDVYFSFGRLALGQQRITDAEANAELALQKTNAGSFNQAQIDHFKKRYYEIKFQTAKARGQLDSAQQFLQQLESVVPKSPQVFLGKAELAFEAKNVDQALDYLNQLHSISKGESQVPQITIAGWFQRKGKVQNADLWIKKAAAENPDDAKVQIAAAQWALNREKFTDTLRAVKAMESISGETNLSGEFRGKVAFAQGAYETAQEKFEALLSANPGNVDYANMLALSMIQSTDEEKQKNALELARKVAGAQRNSPVALSSLAYVMLKSGETEGARALLAKVAQIPNPNPEVSFIMAYMLAETGQMPQAKSVLEKVVQVKGLFLFRNEAQKLLQAIGQASQGLPGR